MSTSWSLIVKFILLFIFFFFFFYLIMLDVVSFMYEKHRIIVDNLTLEILSPENEL
jgi:hypothetical protein